LGFQILDPFFDRALVLHAVSDHVFKLLEYSAGMSPVRSKVPYHSYPV
jgi:hypothetical protein